MSRNLMEKPYPVYRLVLSEFAYGKIDYICKSIANTEWSGVLFYTVEGSFDNGSLVINGVDIHIMNIGDSVYTSYDTSPEIISYMTDNNLLDCQIGLIHSHHTMGTHFSATDLKTLYDNGLSSNHFVSLIVNNNGVYRAKITRNATINKTISEKTSFNSFNNEHVVESSKKNECIKEVQSFDLEVIYNTKYAELENRILDLWEEAHAKLSEKSIGGSLQLGLSMGCQHYDSDIDEEDSYAGGCSRFVPEDELLKIVSQIVTGTIEANYDMDGLTEFVEKKMYELYSSRFGSKYPTKDFSEWATVWIKYVCRERLIMGTSYTRSELMRCALELILSLYTNPYLEGMQRILEAQIYVND